MTKQHFISLADTIRHANKKAAILGEPPRFGPKAIEELADFCATENPAFKRGRWLSYIAGECGPNGGMVKR